MTERVGENDVAAGVSQLSSLIVALLSFGNVGDQGILNAQLLAGSLGGVDKVQVVGRVLVMQGDEANLEIGGRLLGIGIRRGSIFALGTAAGSQGEDHRETEEQSKKLLHFSKSSFILSDPGQKSGNQWNYHTKKSGK